MAAAWATPPAGDHGSQYHGLSGQRPLPSFGSVTPIINPLAQYTTTPVAQHTIKSVPQDSSTSVPTQHQAVQTQSVRPADSPAQRSQQPVERGPSSVFGRVSQIVNRLLSGDRPSPTVVTHKAPAPASTHTCPLPSFGAVTPLGQVAQLSTWPPVASPPTASFSKPSVAPRIRHYKPLNELLKFLRPDPELLAVPDTRAPSPSLPPPIVASRTQSSATSSHEAKALEVPPTAASNIQSSPTPRDEGQVLEVFSDGSFRDFGHKTGLGGCGVAYKSLQGDWFGRAVSLGRIRNSDDAEKWEISYAYQLGTAMVGEAKMLIIRTDSVSAIQQIEKAVKTGIIRDPIIARIIEQDGDLRARGITTEVGWVKGHSLCVGNNVADSMADEGRTAAMNGVPAGIRFDNPNRQRVEEKVQATAIRQAFQDLKNSTCYDDAEKERATRMMNNMEMRQRMKKMRSRREQHLNRQQGGWNGQRLAALEKQAIGSQTEQRSLKSS